MSTSSMASTTARCEIFLAIVLTLSISQFASAGDPDIITDFLAPPNVTIDGNFFTYTTMRSLNYNYNVPKFQVLKASVNEFPALNGQSVSIAVLRFPAGSVNPPHIHPRASELLYLFYGTLEVGFVDSTKKLYTQKLQTGDMFVFPKGLVHYQLNTDANQIAVAVSAFGSVNAGTVSIPGALFNTSIDDGILAMSFKTDLPTIQKLKAGLKA